MSDFKQKLTQLQIAYAIAKRVHGGRIDKSGYPEFDHPLAVEKLCETEKQRCIALLHDVVEETAEWTGKPITLDDLRAWGVDEGIVVAVDCLTRRKGEKIGTYLDRVASDLDAAEVKDFDMFDNMSQRRNEKLPQKKRMSNVRKYAKRRVMLANRILPPEIEQK